MTDRTMLRLLAAALPALLLAGCGGHKAKDKTDQRTASGEVLQGTISDSMLPLARVTSQPPRLKAQPSENAGTDQGNQTGTPGDAPPIAADSAPAN
jgi:uncharacterized protein YcfL